MVARRLGDCWSSIRGLLDDYSTKNIKEILGKAGVPIFKIGYTGTHKGPVLDGADLLIKHFDHDTRDRIVIGCVEEIVAFEESKNANLLKYGNPIKREKLEEVEKVLSRVGYGISGKNIFPLTLQLDLETASLPNEVSEAIAEALRRYRDGRNAGAITSVCGAVDKITERLYEEKDLGNHKEDSFQQRVSRSFATFEEKYCQPLIEKGLDEDEVKHIWNNHRKAVSQTAYVLGAYRREYSDAHGEQNSPDFVQKSLDCAVFILRSIGSIHN